MISILLFATTTLLYAFLFVKYLKLKKEVNGTIINEQNRYGHYNYSLRIIEENHAFDSMVFVKEIERYKNGESKVEIDRIDYCIAEEKMMHDKIKKFIYDNFKSVMKTDSITWLEIDKDVKEIRRNKLDVLKKKFKL